MPFSSSQGKYVMSVDNCYSLKYDLDLSHDMLKFGLWIIMKPAYTGYKNGYFRTPSITMASLNSMGFYYVFGTIFFTVYGQLILKWRIEKYGSLPDNFLGKLSFLFGLLHDPFILSGFVSAFVASFFWMAAMTKLDLSYAYHFISLSFVLVFFLSTWLFQEPVTVYKVVGLLLIVTGIMVSSRSL